ncbi:MAG: M13 family metallopeptidase [Thermomicrobiales bacterium]
MGTFKNRAISTRMRPALTIGGALAALAGTRSIGALAQASVATPVGSPSASPMASPVMAGASGHGIQIADMDLSVNPGDDFYRFANGGWLDRTTLPADRPSIGSFYELEERISADLQEIVAALPDDPATDAGKARAVYAMYHDEAARDALGIAPIQPILDRIAAIATREDALAYQVTSAFADGITGLFRINVGPSLEDATVNVANLKPFRPLLPAFELYMSDEPQVDAVRQAWIMTTTQLFMALGYEDNAAFEAATGALDFETDAVSVMTPPQAIFADPMLANNPMTLAQLKETVPSVAWDAWLTSMGITGVDSVVVSDLAYISSLEALLQATDPAAIRAWFTAQLIWSTAPYLTSTTNDIAFSFNGPILTGTVERRPIDEESLEVVKSVFPDALGQAFVDRAFSPEAKAAIDALVTTIIAAFRARIDAAPWMTDATRVKALEKLDLMTVKVGYPETWRSYADVTLADDLVTTINNASIASAKADFAKIGQPVDRTAWASPVFTINAYYNPQANEIVFPAAILQPPFFDPLADAASNLGAIGSIIGHEITHGFDFTGSQFDGYGNVSSWWTDEDRAAFIGLNMQVIEQFGAIEVLPGLFVNGQMTVTENVADLGGLQTAFDALTLHLDKTGQTAPIDDFTPQQRFFIAAASLYRSIDADEYLALVVQSDNHTPGRIRSVQALRNMDSFFEAFAIKEHQAMYLLNDQRVVIW